MTLDDMTMEEFREMIEIKQKFYGKDNVLFINCDELERAWND